MRMGAKKRGYTGMIKGPKERRVNKGRLGMTMPCVVCADGKTFNEDTIFDISQGGMCFFSNKCLEVGRVIEIQCNAIWDKPKKGTVRWCQRVQHNLYRIGILFL
jgi:hypothetical protein